jgi:hypothetical protein
MARFWQMRDSKRRYLGSFLSFSVMGQFLFVILRSPRRHGGFVHAAFGKLAFNILLSHIVWGLPPHDGKRSGELGIAQLWILSLHCTPSLV